MMIVHIKKISCFIIILFTSIFAKSQNKNFVVQSNEIALEIIKQEKIAPPMAAFIVAVSNDTAYLSFKNSNNDDRALVYKAAFIKVLLFFSPNKAEYLKQLMDMSQLTTSDMAKVDHIVNSRLAFLKSHLDSAISPFDFNWDLSNELGVWKKTAPHYLEPLLPNWGKNFKWAPENENVIFKNLVMPLYSSDQGKAELEEVLKLGKQDSTFRTAYQSETAHFWKGGAGTVTPPGLWLQIALERIISEKISVHKSAQVMRILSMALSDAGVYAWHLKYSQVCWRPITAIQHQSDKDWMPHIATPPFPAYVSGHSTFSMAGATVLSAMLPLKKNKLAVTSSDLPDLKRDYKSYTEAALEAGMSRIYGGIHFQSDNVDGLKLGRRTACANLKKYSSYSCQ